MSTVNLERARANFADDIRRRGAIKSAALIEGLATVPREDFLGPGPWRILRPAEMEKGYQSTSDEDPRHLYDNVLVALHEDRMLNNGEPLGLLLFLDSLELSSGDRLLHIGCGVGYYTAIAAHAVGPRGSVVGVEIDRDLGSRADRNLRSYRNVKVVMGDGAIGTFGSIRRRIRERRVYPAAADLARSTFDRRSVIGFAYRRSAQYSRRWGGFYVAGEKA